MSGTCGLIPSKAVQGMILAASCKGGRRGKGITGEDAVLAGLLEGDAELISLLSRFKTLSTTSSTSTGSEQGFFFWPVLSS